MTRVYGWRPDLPDKRDRYHAPRFVGALPERVDLSPIMPPAWDQGSIGSCVAFAVAGAVVYELAREGEELDPSFLALYYECRELDGTVDYDAGSYLRTGAKVAAQEGIARASLWPYVTHRYNDRPSKAARRAALDHRVSSYARVVRTRDALRHTLAGGDTIVFGATLYESFERVDSTGIVQLPAASDALLGGHAMLIVGYDNADHRFKVRNSWGTQWGDEGYAYMPYDYILDPDLSDDFWTLKAVTT